MNKILCNRLNKFDILLNYYPKKILKKVKKSLQLLKKVVYLYVVVLTINFVGDIEMTTSKIQESYKSLTLKELISLRKENTKNISIRKAIATRIKNNCSSSNGYLILRDVVLAPEIIFVRGKYWHVENKLARPFNFHTKIEFSNDGQLMFETSVCENIFHERADMIDEVEEILKNI